MAVSLASALLPDVVLMDVRMPVRDGIAATRDIAAAGLRSKVPNPTTFDLDDYVYAGLRAGASGFLLKDTQPDDLVAAIRTIAAGESVLAPTTTSRLIRQFTAQPEQHSDQRAEQIRRALMPREQDVFALIAAGMSNGEIAARMYLSAGTVKIHVGASGQLGLGTESRPSYSPTKPDWSSPERPGRITNPAGGPKPDVSSSGGHRRQLPAQDATWMLQGD